MINQGLKSYDMYPIATKLPKAILNTTRVESLQVQHSYNFEKPALRMNPPRVKR